VILCPGDSVQLNLAGYLNPSTTSGPSVATGYLWVPSTGLSCSTCPNPMASPDSTTTYKAVAYNCPSCADIDSIRITVSQVWVEAPNQILCAGDSIQMQAFHPVPGSSFVWTPTTTLSPANVQYPYAYPTVPTWYYVTATDNMNGCVSEDSAYVLVGYPSPLPNLIPDTTICLGGMVTFPLGEPWTPIGSDYYEWNLVPNVVPDIHDANSDALINTSFPATYHFVLTVTNEFGCITRDSVIVTVGCTILPLTNVTFTGRAGSDGNYLDWFTDPGFEGRSFVLERSADGQHFTPLYPQLAHPNGQVQQDYGYLDRTPLAGDNFYRLQVVDANGQSDYTETILISPDLGNVFAIYPNPTAGTVTLSAQQELLDAQIRLTNTLGQEVFAVNHLKGKTVSFDLADLPEGIYLMEMKEKGVSSWVKVVRD
jgi:hypothetical protein